MTFEERHPLSEAERKYPSAEYYDRKPVAVGVLQNQILNTASPMSLKDAILGENWISLIDSIEQYSNGEYGYCMLDESRGYMANYLYWTNIRPEINAWWYRWINIRPKDVPEGQGNLHYKLWCPGVHFDHGYINGKDRSNGYYAQDYDPDGNIITTMRYPVNPVDFGVKQERIDALTAQGYMFDCAWETGEGGMHLSLNAIHKLPNGHIEKRTRTWIGYGLQDGRVVKDENACCTETMLREMLHHQSAEGRYVDLLVPELYARFGHLPEDET